MTSGVRLSASESLLTLPADSPAYLVSDEQGQCQLWPWGCVFHQMPLSSQQGGWMQSRKLCCSPARPAPGIDPPVLHLQESPVCHFGIQEAFFLF